VKLAQLRAIHGLSRFSLSPESVDQRTADQDEGNKYIEYIKMLLLAG